MTKCVKKPSEVYPDEPTAPKPGEPITDTYIKALKAWGNRVLGIATGDRITWRGERRCINELVEDGQIQ